MNWTIEQLSAINESGKNIIVSAGAGSGKTAVLSERVLRELKEGVSLDNLLILTFTNLAALEMKERIRKKIIKENLVSELDKVDSSDITTFDAYALSLVKKYSYLLNISSNISIVDNSIIRLKKIQYLNDIFEEYYDIKDENFLKMIDELTLKDDKEIIDNILRLNDSLDNLYDKENYLKNYNIDIDKYILEYEKLLLEKVNNIKSIIHNLSFYVDGDYLNKVNEVFINLFNSSNYNDIKKNIPLKIPNLPRGSEEEAKIIKKELSLNYKELITLTKYDDIKTMKDSLLKSLDYVNIIIKIILKLDKKVMEFKHKNNVYEFIDISRMAIDLVKNNESVKENLKNKYHEILIDEYQDTNDIQEEFISLISNNNVYMVGDIKQSIYRFRHTNPNLFKNKYESFSKGENGYKIDLNKNFRSRKNVLNGINGMFGLLMNGYIGGAEYKESHEMIFGNESYNDFTNENYDMDILNYDILDDLDYSKEEIEIFTIAKDIKNKVNSFELMNGKKCEYSDIAILIDRSSSFELYKKIFEYLNIPITIYRDKAINCSDEIVLLKHIYNLVFNFDKYSFVSVARSYLFSMDDDEIFSILNNKSSNEIYDKCLKLRENIDNKTNEIFIREIVDTFDFYNKIITTTDIQSRITVIDCLIKVAINCDKLGYTLKDFYNYLCEITKKGLDIKLSLSKNTSNSVKIMTIHASKGLEFPICYFSGLSKKFNIRDLNQLFYFSDNYGFIIPYYDNGLKSTFLKTLLKENYVKEEISERLRLFYVALTRAKEKMIIVTSLEDTLSFKNNGVIADNVRLKYRSFNDVLNSIYGFLSKYIIDINIDDINLTKEYNFGKNGVYKSSSSNKLIVKELDIKKAVTSSNKFSKTTHKLFTDEERKNIELGLKLHKVLENVDFDNPDFSELSSFESNKIKAFLENDILKNSINIYKEYEFIYDDGKEYHGIIDLLLIKEKENVIIDYKLNNITDEAYINQLNGYKKYVEMITGKETKIYLYSLLEEKLVSLN